MYPQLNLPPFTGKVKKVGEKPYIFDAIRKKFVLLTPEEWVRQHFIHFLINKGYPRSLFSVETGLYYHTMKKRTDILVLSNDGTPFLLAECKAPSVRLSNDVFHQIARYNFTLKPRYLVVTNGMEHVCFRVTEDAKVEFLAGLPIYNQQPDE